MSTREDIIAALEAGIVAQLPSAAVARNLESPAEVPEGGQIVIREQGIVTIDEMFGGESPIYTLELSVDIEVYASGSTIDATLDGLVGGVFSAVRADVSFGGRAVWAKVTTDSYQMFADEGAEPVKSALLTVVVQFDSVSEVG